VGVVLRKENAESERDCGAFSLARIIGTLWATTDAIDFYLLKVM
jgi:hypothetical protein